MKKNCDAPKDSVIEILEQVETESGRNTGMREDKKNVSLGYQVIDKCS